MIRLNKYMFFERFETLDSDYRVWVKTGDIDTSDVEAVFMLRDTLEIPFTLKAFEHGMSPFKTEETSLCFYVLGGSNNV